MDNLINKFPCSPQYKESFKNVKDLTINIEKLIREFHPEPERIKFLCDCADMKPTTENKAFIVCAMKIQTKPPGEEEYKTLYETKPGGFYECADHAILDTYIKMYRTVKRDTLSQKILTLNIDYKI